MVVIKKKLIKLEEFLEKNPKIKKKFNKEFKKYENRPKPNKKLKIGNIINSPSEIDKTGV